MIAPRRLAAFKSLQRPSVTVWLFCWAALFEELQGLDIFLAELYK